MRALNVFVSLLLASSVAGQELELRQKNTRWRVSYESLDVDGRGRFDLVGLHYDLLGVAEAFPPLYVGLGGFTQVAGTEEGFLAAGLDVGALWQPTPDWIVDAGVFLGGGGLSGGSAQSGWALRPFVGLERVFGLFGVRAEAAYFDMDGFEGEFTFSFGISVSSEVLLARERTMPEEIPGGALFIGEERFSARLVQLDPSSGSRDRRGRSYDQDIHLVGLGFDYFLGENLFLPVEAYGAVRGDVAGFGLVMLGLGYRLPLGVLASALEFKALAAVGGGGNVDTGGSLGWELRGGLRSALTRHLSAEVSAGFLRFPAGEFEASTLSAGLSWSASPLGLDLDYPRAKLGEAGVSEEIGEVHRGGFTLLSKFYSPRDGSLTRSGRPLEDTISLFGVEYEEPLLDFLSVTARAFVAADGNVGGYREGLLGLRLFYAPKEYPDHLFTLSGEAGTAGGGDVDVGAGRLRGASLGYQYAVGENTRLIAEYGGIESRDGSFDAASVVLGLRWNLDRAVALR